MRPSEQQPNLNRDRRSTPATGTRAVRQQSRVRALLGMPDAAGVNLAASPASPMAGFGYRLNPTLDYRIGDEAPVSQAVTRGDGPNEDVAQHPSVDLEAVEFLQAAVNSLEAPETPPQVGQESASERRSMPDKRPARATAHVAGQARGPAGEEPLARTNPGKQEIEPKRPAANNAACPPGAGASRRPEQTTPEGTERPAQPDEPIEQVRVEIPGVSAGRLSFPALVSTQEQALGADRAEARPQAKGSAAGTSQDRVGAAGAEGPALVPTRQVGSAEESLAAGNIVVAKAAGAASLSESETQPKAEPEADAGAVQAAEPPGFSAAITARPPEPEAPGETEPDAPAPPPGQDGGLDLVYRANQEAAANIEQLRRAVQQLSAKVAAQRVVAEPETSQPPPEAPPPPPAPPVVVVNQPAAQPRAPRAYWERRYLGRFQLRRLR